MLAINEEFESYQGEGSLSGNRMYFVRLQGCAVGCYFCDTKYTWRNGMPDVDEWDIIGRANKTRARWICITGGEPLEQDISQLVHLAHDNQYKVQIETSGMYYSDILEHIDWVCVSPKNLFALKGMEFSEKCLKYCHEIKCVVTKEDDIEYYINEFTDFKGSKVFQPVDNSKDIADLLLSKSTSRIADWKVMIQQHKVVGLR